MKDVTVVIRTRQAVDGENNEFSQIASGTLEQTAEGFLLRYTEKDENGLATDNQFLFGGERAFLKRTGAVNSEMRFRVGANSVFPYRTFYGSFDLTLHTEYLRACFDEQGGKAMIRYTLSAHGQLMGEYTLKLHITEKDD